MGAEWPSAVRVSDLWPCASVLPDQATRLCPETERVISACGVFSPVPPRSRLRISSYPPPVDSPSSPTLGPLVRTRDGVSVLPTVTRLPRRVWLEAAVLGVGGTTPTPGGRILSGVLESFMSSSKLLCGVPITSTSRRLSGESCSNVGEPERNTV